MKSFYRELGMAICLTLTPPVFFGIAVVVSLWRETGIVYLGIPDTELEWMCAYWFFGPLALVGFSLYLDGK